MKTIYTIHNFAKRLVMVLAVGLIAVNAWGTDVEKDDVLLLESFKSGSGGTTFSAVTYSSTYSSLTMAIPGDASSILYASSDACFSTSDATNMSGTHVWLNANTTGYVEIDDIPLHNTTKFKIGCSKTGNAGLKLYYKFNGEDSWTEADDWPNAARADSLTAEKSVTSGKTSISIKIARKSNNKAQRIDNIKLVATAVAPSGYAVTYNNGGHGTAPSSTTASSVTLAAITGVTGYTCTGWKANVAVTVGGVSQSAGTLLTHGSTATLSGATTFTAQWSANEYTITLDDGDGSGGDGTIAVTYDANTNLTSGVTVPTLEHFDFGGYYTGENGTGTQIIDDEGAVNANVTNYTSSTKQWIKADDVTLHAKWTEHSLTNYRTSCCTELATVSGAISVGSINETGGTASWSWSGATTGISKNILKVYNTSDVLVKTIDNISASATSQSISGLDPCTSYYVTLTTVASSSAYCDGAEQGKSSNFTTNGWAVHYTGGDEDEGALLSNVTKVTGASQACLSEDYVATFTANTGYKLPENIVVYIASSEATAGDDYTWSITSGTGTLTIETDDLSEEIDVRIIGECVNPEIGTQPASATYQEGASPSALTVAATLASGTLTYQWQKSTDGGSNWSNESGTGYNTATYAAANISTALVANGVQYRCIVGNSEGGCSVTSSVATITITAAANFSNGATVFIQAESSSAWDASACVKAWFNNNGAGGAAQETFWLFDATGGDAGKKLFATVVPASGDLNQVTLQRFDPDSDCDDFWNNNGTLTKASDGGSNTFRSTGSGTSNVAWNGSGVTLDLYGDPSDDDWESSLASFSDQGAGVWTATYENYAPANAAGESQNFKAKTNYNGWIGNTGSNSNATLDGMHVGSTYNITATLDVTDHSLVMNKTFVKGEVSFDLQGHGSAIAKLTNVAAGSKISAPSEPSATGYTFGGWFTDAECTDEWTFASDEVNETMTLYAKWTANVYTITKTLTNVSNTGLPSSFTYTGATTTALNSTFTVDATNFFLPSSIAVTMGGATLTAGTHYTYNNSTGAFTFSAVITGNIVITATATAKLKSIAITTQPTTRKYFAGESFSSTGAVVTATMGDGSTKAVTASATWTPPATPLAAGTSLTVTASYTENGINQTATTTIDVYSVTVNKKNEDGDAIDVAGVSATWTVGTKALAAGVGSTKYAFKEWQVTGATAASTTSANTTLSNPTANVVVNAVFWKPRVVKWSVNGNDSYETGSPTTTVAYNGTISTVPTNPSGLVCASTFIAWTDAAHNNGTTAKDDDSYYESKLFTDAGDFPNITAATTTFYAVFAESAGAAVNTVMWSEDWTGATTSDGTTGKDEAKPSAQGSHSGKTIYGGGSVTYEESSNATYVRNENTGGGTAPELMIKASEAFTISGIPSGGASELTLTYKRNNQALTPTVSGTDYSISYVSGSGKDTYTYTITCGSGTTFNLIFTAGSSNVRLDDVQVKVKTVNLTDYVTECDANIVSVTYDANSGSTSCMNTTTDKTEDFTVCSSAPTRDYYTFAGWLCSADDEVYQANATIDDAVIDADFTLTAQWNPVTYNITYELDGGTNDGDNPATYNIETATITLEAPTKGHDRFDGWYDNSTFTGDAITSIPVGSHGNITLYAKWATRHEIVFDYTESASSGSTTIWRADDEDISASVAGQGSVPSDPSAPTACSSKVFVGWSENTIDDETDDEPADLMKPAEGTVAADKHYYAVWATASAGSVTKTYDWESATIPGWSVASAFVRTASQGVGSSYAGKLNSSGTHHIKFKEKVNVTSFSFQLKRTTNNENYSCSIDVSTDGTNWSEAASFDMSSFANGSYNAASSKTWDGNTAYYGRLEVYTTDAVRYVDNVSITYNGNNYTAYSTSCCATNVTLSQNSPSNGTIEFGKTKVGTCGDKEVSLTITPAAGYQLHTYEVATGSGKVATKSVSPAISLDNNSSAAQNITLTFADEANGAYDVTASFTEMTVTSWTWTNHDGGAAVTTDPFEIYVGQSAQVDVAYNPSTVLSSHKTYTRTKDDAYINWPGGAKPSGYCTFIGKASTGENTTTITLTHSDASLTQLVYVKVLPLPLTHFEDLVHGKSFDDVVATIADNALSATKTTPTSDDWTTPNANSCEENHLHLVGWIREDWPALVAYLAGTGDAPSTAAIAGAGNDGSGNAYFFAPNASINVQTFDGVTFYAVWAQIE